MIPAVGESYSSLDIKNPLLGRIGVISAGIPSLSLIASVFYDWGFFFSIGISFAEVPTVIADHFRSWLVWLPDVTICVVFVLLIEMLTRRIERGMTEDEIVASTSNPKWIKKFRDMPFRLIEILGPTLVIVWLLFGGSLTKLLIGSIISWLLISRWVFSLPLVKQRHSPLFHTLFHWGPPILAFFFWLGFSSGEIAMARSEQTHVPHTKNAHTGTALVLNTTVLRSFEKYFLARSGEGKIEWIQTKDIHFLEQAIKVPTYKGLICDSDFWERLCPKEKIVK